MSDLEAVLAGQQRIVERLRFAQLVPAAANGETFTLPAEIGGELRHELRTAITSLAIRELWTRGQPRPTAFAVHPQMHATLRDHPVRSLRSANLNWLPHNPMVVLLEPTPTITALGDYGRILGFYTYGIHTATRRLTSVHEPDTDLGLLVVTAILDESGTRVDTELSRLTLPRAHTIISADRIVEATLAPFPRRYHTVPIRTAFTHLADIALTVLDHICTQRPDSVLVPFAGSPAHADRRRGRG
ncbi:hypothetical protein ACTD5D_40125 [Nocardia takedensis]|uniref:hypothetical protein n=1 Tax=Nocardia takedensis TaxID=259390 RepID=UPI003F773838